MNNYLVPIRYRHIKFSISDQEKKKIRERKTKETERGREMKVGGKMENLEKKG